MVNVGNHHHNAVLANGTHIWDPSCVGSAAVCGSMEKKTAKIIEFEFIVIIYLGHRLTAENEMLPSDSIRMRGPHFVCAACVRLYSFQFT